jgi:hypothetical protein
VPSLEAAAAFADSDTGSAQLKLEIDEGTPIEGTTAAAPSAPSSATENVFVAGEIDVPTPAPEKRIDPPATVDAPEFIAASSRLGGAEPGGDPDTGSRTPALERRNP